MTNTLRVLALLFLGLVLLPSFASASERVALVIGNGAYAFGPLDNAANDARLMTQSLEQTGFSVSLLLDADERAMKTAIRTFADRLQSSSPDTVALFYFAGHGVQLNGRNYLIPTKAEVRSAADVEFASIEAQWVLDLIGESRKNLSIVILDACRNNPFPSIARSAPRGLARMDAPRGSLLAFSTAPGAVALDGLSNNSPYTSALARKILEPGLKIEEVFKEVRREVLTTTKDQQVPWESSSLIGDFYFSGSAGAAPLPASLPASIPPGKTFRDCADCPEMASLPGGKFTMGGSDGESGEEPTEVAVRSFAIGRYEVTRGEFRKFVNATGRRVKDGCWHWWLVWGFDAGRAWDKPGYEQSDNHPVVCTTYQDARAYADWITQISGKRYRLPSEAEWEYAASAGKGRMPWGTDYDASCAYANVHDRTGKSLGVPLSSVACDDGYVMTAPVGQFIANAYGLSDMIGNGWEMVDDCWNKSHRGRPLTAASRQDGDCGFRVWKGSNMTNYGDSFRSEHRQPNSTSQPNIYGGFRLVRDLN
ncbi:MAG: SUMF1/EgtB/PvdO family nonheme iron enzyme [Pseudomonadota bacterium]